MVISSSTQWTIPLNSSISPPLSASSPSLTRPGSVLGLKTCQLSAPPHAIINASSELHHPQDLHSTSSSRRLQGAEYAPSRRSAGSFRQLVYEDFCTQLAHEDVLCPGSPDWACDSKDVECKYAGIAMPLSSSGLPYCPLDAAAAHRTALNANLVDVQDGDITADDVDLLPMPGLLSCSSPFYAGSYLPQTQSPNISRNIEISSPETSANSCKSSVMVPNYLGLPPDHLNAGMVGNVCHASLPLTPTASTKHARGGGAHDGKETNNFADALAGLWSNTMNRADPEHILHDCEGFTSLFSVYPQNFHDFSSSEQSCVETCNNNESAQVIMDDLQYLINSGRTGSDEEVERSVSLCAISLGNESLHLGKNGESAAMEVTQAHRQSCNVMTHSDTREQKSTVKAAVADTFAGASGSIHTETTSAVKKVPESTGLKRLFSVLDFASMTSSMTSTSAYMPGSNAWRAQPNAMGLPVTLEEHEGPHRFSPLLYKSQKEPTLADLYYQHGGVSDDGLMPKPPPAKVRRKHGTAMDPQSVAARTRREKFSDRIRILQRLVPNAERLDTVSMLGQTLEYVRFLQHQVWQLYHGKDPASPENICEKWKDFVVETERASAN